MSGNATVVRRWVKCALQGEPTEDVNEECLGLKSHHPGSTWLLEEEVELQVELKQYLREHGCEKGVPNLTARKFAGYIHSNIIHQLSSGRQKPILVHEDTNIHTVYC